MRDGIDLVVLAAIWGASFLFMRIAAPEFGPVPLIAARVTVAAVFLVIVLAVRGGIQELYVHAPALIFIGAFSAAIPFSLFAYSLLSVTAGFASMINATVPLFGAVVAYFWLGETLGPNRALGLGVGFVGVLVLVWGKISFAPGGSGMAVVAGLSASFLFGVAASFTKRFLSGVDPLITATGSQLAAAFLMLIPAIILWPAGKLSPLGAISAIVLGIVCTGFALIVFFRLISRVGPAKAITVTYLIPAFGVVWGYVFLDEPVTVNMLAGCGVILLGTALANGLLSTRQ